MLIVNPAALCRQSLQGVQGVLVDATHACGCNCRRGRLSFRHEQSDACLMAGIRGRMNDLQVTVEQPDGSYKSLATGEIRQPSPVDEAMAQFRRTGSTEKLEELGEAF